MPRDLGEFRIGAYFLRRYPGSANWYAAWFDAASRQTRRTSLGTPDREAAKVELARLVTIHGDLRDARPEAVTLAQVFQRYHEHHAKGLPSGREQLRHLGFWQGFFGAEATVADAHPTRQHRFVAALEAKGYGAGYIKRVLGSGRAALRWCHKRGELLAVPHVIATEDSRPRGRVLDAGEILALWQAAEDGELRRYLMLLLNTACRPEAARDLGAFQVDLARNRLDLNPAGRAQTKKRRPIVPITGALRPWLKVEGRERLIGRGEKWLGDAWRAARDRAGLDAAVVPYTVRHTVATELDERNAAENEITAFMGWPMSHRMRGWYTKRRIYRPDYCGTVVAALDAWMGELGLQSEAARASTRAASDPVNLALRASSLQAQVATGGKTLGNAGAGEGIRTLDPNLGKVVLYP